jgi:3-oxoacyl-[acyl-carrier protein] reductase
MEAEVITLGPGQRSASDLIEDPQAHRLEGRVAIVTGAGHGIGKVYARRLAAEGARVVVADIDYDAATSVASKFSDAGLICMAAQVDVSDATSLDSMAARVQESMGQIDILVNNAAIFSVVPMSRVGFAELTPEEWDRMMDVNLKGVWLACRSVSSAMIDRGYGKIINVSSVVALNGSPSRIHYVTSKAGVIGFTRSLARELGQYGITVNCVAPGSTLSEENPSESVTSRRFERAASRAVQRPQYPADLAGTVAFFASRDSDFVTGQTLVVDGGGYLL